MIHVRKQLHLLEHLPRMLLCGLQSGTPVSISATGLAYQIIADVQALHVKLTPEAEKALTSFVSQAPRVCRSTLAGCCCPCLSQM